MVEKFKNKIIVRHAIKRKVGYVYWIDEKGNICGKDMLKGQSK